MNIEEIENNSDFDIDSVKNNNNSIRVNAFKKFEQTHSALASNPVNRDNELNVTSNHLDSYKARINASAIELITDDINISHNDNSSSAVSTDRRIKQIHQQSQSDLRKSNANNGSYDNKKNSLQ